MGIPEKSITGVLTNPEHNDVIIWIIIILVLVIVLSAIGAVYFGDSADATSSSAESQTSISPQGAVAEKGESAFFATIFHPKMLGLALIMLIAALAAIMIARDQVPR